MDVRPNAHAQHRCMAGCIMNCSQVYTDADGTLITSGLEFETLGLLGANCGISDLDQIAHIDRLCDDLGLDTMEIGAAVGVAMEGGLLEWGDGAAVHDLLDEAIPPATSTRGCSPTAVVATGAALGVARVPAVKGQGMAAYDPRVLKGTGHHLRHQPPGRGPHVRQRPAQPRQPRVRPGVARGAGADLEFLQCYFAAIDALGMCLFATLPALDMPELQA